MAAYYNEIDPYAAQWLRNLIAAGHIAPGDVDERSILEVKADDLRRYTQCYFFAGIGGWSHALHLAGWPNDRPVWTGSCPCQPFSAAGKQRGSNDERHLWPAFFDLIRECRPAKVFGEQVAGAAGLAWWDHVAADLEGEGYAAAAADLPACGIGAAHARQRVYWVAADTAGEHGEAYGVLEPGREWEPPLSVGRLPSVAVHGGWWQADGGNERLPTLVRNHHGLSGALAGFGNAIVPQVAAVFVLANQEINRNSRFTVSHPTS
jgi:DNA (cytosine-5)-methyltransferase 1